jgi:Cu2+-exporting ATPase
MAAASTEKPELALLADRLAKPFLWGVLLLAGLAAMLGWQQSPGHALMVAVAVLIVTCPCALSLATPAAMLASAGALAKRGTLVRRLQALESLSKVDTFIFDKTGTLTQDGLVLQNVQTRTGWSPERACQLAALLGAQSLHPVSRAMNAHAAGLDLPKPEWQVAEQTELAGGGIQASIRLKPSNQLEFTTEHSTIHWGSAHFCSVPALETTAVQAHLADDAGWLASFEFQERIRPDAAATLQALQAAGIKVQLLSGDSQTATQHLAESLSIANYKGLCTPSSKLVTLQALQQQGHRVAMVGDGLNDGPALAAANVSFAFGKAVPLAQSKSDFMVLGDQLANIAAALLHARQTLRIVKQNLAWALIYNFVAIPFAIAGWLPAWLAGIGMAASSLLVVGNSMRLTAMRQTAIPQTPSQQGH